MRNKRVVTTQTDTPMETCETAMKRRDEAERAEARRDYGEAARCYVFAAEAYEKQSWDQEGCVETIYSNAMRQAAIRNIRARDAHAKKGS